MCFVDVTKTLDPLRLKNLLSSLNQDKIPNEIKTLVRELSRETNLRYNKQTYDMIFDIIRTDINPF